MTFVRETDDFRPETPEPDENDRGFELAYSPPDDSQLTLPELIESIPTEIPSNDSPSQEPSDVAAPSPREAYLIRSYIQKIAAVVSVLPATKKTVVLTVPGRYM